MNNDQLLFDLAALLRRPYVSAHGSIAANADSLDVLLRLAWEECTNLGTMASVCGEFASPEVQSVLYNMMESIPEWSRDISLSVRAREAGVILPSVSEMLLQARRQRFLCLPSNFFNDDYLRMLVLDPLQELLFEIGQYERVSDDWISRNRLVSEYIHSAWDTSADDTRVLFVRYIRPPWWAWFSTMLQSVHSTEDNDILARLTRDRLPDLAWVQNYCKQGPISPYASPYA